MNGLPPWWLTANSFGEHWLPRFTDSYLKGENGKYCTSYAFPTPLKVVEVAPWPLATWAQEAELYGLTQACILVEGKTANIGRPRFTALQILEGLWQAGIWQVYRLQYFSNSICSLCVSVSHFENSHNISNFYITNALVMMMCDQLSLILLV